MGERLVLRTVMLVIEKRVLSGGDAMPWRLALDSIVVGGRAKSEVLALGDESVGEDNVGALMGIVGDVATSTTCATPSIGCVKG